MSRLAPRRSVEDTLTAVSALRRFCLALPHAVTPQEARRLERFERLVTDGTPFGERDIDALLSGLRRCWRDRDTRTLRDVAARIPDRLLARDRWLQSFVAAAQSLAAPGGDGGARSR
jgi:hypothetical protein